MKHQIIFLNPIPNLLEISTHIKKYRISLFIIGVIIAAVLGGKDTNYWGLKDKSGKQILIELEAGILESNQIELTENQLEDIKNLVFKHPEKYSPLQKSLISDKTGEEILNEIEIGVVNINDIYLNFNQKNEIVQLINEAPNNYSEYQKALVKEEAGKQILMDVGLGLKKASQVKLSPNQRKEIIELLLSNPNKYSDDQKILIPEIKEELEILSKELKVAVILDKTGGEILKEVGLGNFKPSEIKLTPKQQNEIKKLLLNNPNNYNNTQKSLIPELKSELRILSKKKKNSLKELIVLDMIGDSVLKEVGRGKYDPTELKLTPDQLNRIKELIKKNPLEFNDNQKSLIK